MAADRSASTRAIVPFTSPWAAMRPSSQAAKTSTMACPRATTSREAGAGSMAPDRSSGHEVLPALVQGGQEVVVRPGEGVDPFALESGGEVVVVDPRFGQGGHHPPGALDVALDGVGLRVAVVLERLDGGGGEGVHRVPPDQLVDVEGVG